jgi:hypothetical protein
MSGPIGPDILEKFVAGNRFMRRFLAVAGDAAFVVACFFAPMA